MVVLGVHKCHVTEFKELTGECQGRGQCDRRTDCRVKFKEIKLDT